MAKKIMIGECQDLLKIMPVVQLKAFAKIRQTPEMWDAIQAFVRDQKFIKLDQMYRLRRPRSNDDMVKNAIEHEYFAGRIAEMVILLQVMENASDEMERREHKSKV